jgi:hypothetical protein
MKLSEWSSKLKLQRGIIFSSPFLLYPTFAKPPLSSIYRAPKEEEAFLKARPAGDFTLQELSHL